MMRLSSRITGLEITQQPEKLIYEPGMTFDGTGLKVTAHYANGSSKDVTAYASFTTEPLTMDDTEITVSYDPDQLFENENTAAGGYWQWYQDVDGQAGQTYYLPTATVTVELRAEHTWDAGSETKAPTCTKDGEITYTCAVCQTTQTETVTAAGHQYNNGVCSVCGEADPDYTLLIGTVESFGSDTQEVTIQLYESGNQTPAYTAVVTGNNASYTVSGIVPGSYTMTVSKENHVTRIDTVTVIPGDNTQDVKICLMGDVNGDGQVNMGDTARIYAHVKGTNLITDAYALLCADATGDGQVNVGDVSKIYAHVRGTNQLW